MEPALFFCQPARRPTAELMELMRAEALVAFLRGTSIPACCLLLYMLVKFGHPPEGLAANRTLDVCVSAQQMLDDKACRRELVAEHAARELSRKAFVEGACQVPGLRVEAVVIAEDAVIAVVAVAVLVVTYGG